MQPVLNPRADRSAVRRVPAPNVLLGNSVGQWQDEHGDLPDRFPPERLRKAAGRGIGEAWLVLIKSSKWCYFSSMRPPEGNKAAGVEAPRPKAAVLVQGDRKSVVSRK